MADYLGKKCKIVWGDSLNKTLSIGYPLDDPHAYPVPRDGHEAVQSSSGTEDAWSVGTDQFLEGTIRWIPKDSGTTEEGNAETGWDGTDGFSDFLTWARGKSVFRFYPDVVGAAATYLTMYLVEPMTARPDREENWERKITLVMRTSDGTAVTGY